MGIDAEMLVRVKRPITDAEVRAAAFDLFAAFGSGNIFVFDKQFMGDRERRALERVEVWEQDGPDIEPEPGETFLRVSLWTRYYGPNYERGNLPMIIAVARFLELKIPGSEIWYGGDSSGVLAEPFGVAERDAMFRHFVEHVHEPYESYFDNDMGEPISRPMCSFCERPMRRNGWGQNGKFGAFYCAGCGQAVETQDGGETFQQRHLVGGREVEKEKARR